MMTMRKLPAWTTLLLLLLVPPMPAQAESYTEAEKNAARFLSQASFGGDLAMIDDVARHGPRHWIGRQIAMPPTLHHPFTSAAVALIDGVAEETFEGFEDEGLGEDELFFVEESVFGTFEELRFGSRRYAWWKATLGAPDQLRQRVAFALSELFVVSDRVERLLEEPEGLASYYDVLVRGALGNYRDLLHEVTLHPVMGVYLSHLNNARSDPTTGRFPDENYAREVMQLFSIGLHELLPNGQLALDTEGRPIPTYGNAEITEFAKIFTGLGPGGPDGEFGDEDLDFTRPMRMYGAMHEPGEKRLLRGLVVPAGQGGMADVEAAIDNLFDHPNVGPFVARRLIQRLVTSNPTPGYVWRVARVFADNGHGVRGDLARVVEAILLDPQARSPEVSQRSDFGHLQEPLLRHIQLLRALGARSVNGLRLDSGGRLEEMLRQHPLSAPSVFNFFLPDHQPIGALAELGLVAPEMQITTSASIIGLANFIEEVVGEEVVMETPELGLVCLLRPALCESLFRCTDEACAESEGEALYDREVFMETIEPFRVTLALDEEIALAAGDVDALLDRLDLLLAQGRMSATSRQVIRQAILPLEEPEDRVRLALYLTLLSPDVAVVN